MKKFFAIAAITLMLVSCAGNKKVKVSDPEKDIAALVEAVKDSDEAKAIEKATEYIESYAKALVEKVITKEQFDAFCDGVSEKLGIAEETVKGVVGSALAKVCKAKHEACKEGHKCAEDHACKGDQASCKENHECKGENAECKGENAECKGEHKCEEGHACKGEHAGCEAAE